MKKQNNKCLLLNSDFTPLSIITWKRAVVWSIKYDNNHKYSIDIIDFYKDDYIIGTNNKKYPIPSIAKTKKFFRTNKESVAFSRKNIFLRDNHTCQYCHQKFNANYLTYDHVIPKSLWNFNNGSPTTWTNIVTACVDCNRKKKNRTPKQANMILKKLPIQPNKTLKYLPVYHDLLRIKDQIPPEWEIYLPQLYNII